MRVPEMFSDHGMFVPLRVDGDGGKCIQYNSYRTNHI